MLKTKNRSAVLRPVGWQADAVAIGRLTGLALAAGGKPALLRALDLLAEEIWIGLGKKLSPFDQSRWQVPSSNMRLGHRAARRDFAGGPRSQARAASAGGR